MKRRIQALLLALCLTTGSLLSGCGGNGQKGEVTATENAAGTETEAGQTKSLAMMQANDNALQMIDDKYRTFYEVFLYSFYDSNGDGTGDIKGLIDKLDYLNDGDDKTDTDLGVNGIWLMPVMPSTTYHKYDVTDYEAIDPEYGTMDDFKKLIADCHDRGINVIIDFVMNHTSSKHPWFTQACDYIRGLNGAEPSAEECPYFDYYNFSREKKNEVYYPVGDTGWYYEGKFWSEMPDLNLASEAVRKEFDDITSYWLDLGVDGFRMDASGEYYSGQNDKNVEVLSWFNDMVKAKKEDAYIVCECWTDIDTYAQYYASGVDSMFNFAFANTDGTIANCVKKVGKATASTYGKKAASLQKKFGEYNENYIDAPFYSNHDMGRNAGYYSGEAAEAQTKMGAAMNLMMSGAAYVYYGDELGMKGSGKDENKRAPMYWSKDASAEGMCKGPSDMDAVKMKYDSLEEQQNDPLSIYNFYKQAIKLRNEYPQIARGSVEFVKEMSDDNICVLTKEYDGTQIMLVFNISDQEQAVDVSDVKMSPDAELAIGGMLTTGEDAVTLEYGELTMPAYSVVILK